MGKKKHHKKKEAKKAAAPAPAPEPGADGAEASGMSSYLSSMAQQLWGPAAEAAPPAARVLDEVPESWIAAGRRYGARAHVEHERALLLVVHGAAQ